MDAPTVRESKPPGVIKMPKTLFGKTISRPAPRALAMLIGASVLVGGIATGTAAYFTDNAKVSIGAANSGAISVPSFSLGMTDDENQVVLSSDTSALNVAVPGGNKMIPGTNATSQFVIFNNSESHDAAVTFSVEPVGDGSVATKPNILRFLRFSATDHLGNVLFENATIADAKGSAVVLEARGRPAIPAGSPYIAGADGSWQGIYLKVEYLDDPETVNYNGGQSAFQLVFDGVSET
jgi:predicted ribosomally synthesized peptide with SipW-like signal peptide